MSQIEANGEACISRASRNGLPVAVNCDPLIIAFLSSIPVPSCHSVSNEHYSVSEMTLMARSLKRTRRLPLRITRKPPLSTLGSNTPTSAARANRPPLGGWVSENSEGRRAFQS